MNTKTTLSKVFGLQENHILIAYNAIILPLEKQNHEI